MTAFDMHSPASTCNSLHYGTTRLFDRSQRKSGAWSVVVLLLAVGCQVRDEGAARADGGLDLASYEIVDLTHPLNEQTIFWPTSPTTFRLERLADGPTPGGYFYSANAFSMPEHGGTHLDAPIHFGEGRHTTDAIPLERLVASGVVIDVAERAAADPEYRL